MIKRDQIDFEQALAPLLAGRLVVLPTDTIYGLVCSTRFPESVEQLYAVRQRDSKMACIILIGSISQLREFGIESSAEIHSRLTKYWPGPTSIVLPNSDPKWTYLRRGGDTLAFRLPDYPALQSLLLASGPLVAPSANPAGQPPATTIAAAERYFGAKVTTYIDGGTLTGAPSRLIALDSSGSATVLRV